MDTVYSVREFHVSFGLEMRGSPGWPALLEDGEQGELRGLSSHLAGVASRLKLIAGHLKSPYLIRMQLIVEEAGEFAAALANQDLPNALQELTDLIYVVDGGYVLLGLTDLKEAAFAEVHRANMAKLDADGRPIIHESGRVVKPPGWTPPDVAKILEGK